METTRDIATLLNGYQLPQRRKRANERGDLLVYFASKLDRKIPSFSWALKGLELVDLYYIKSDCDQAEARGIPWGAAFWSSLKKP